MKTPAVNTPQHPLCSKVRTGLRGPGFLCLAAIAALFFSATFAIAEKAAPAPPPLRLVLPPDADATSTDPALREFVLRVLAYEDQPGKVLEALAREQDAAVLRAALDALAATGGAPDAATFDLRLCDSPDPDTASLAYSLLPAFCEEGSDAPTRPSREILAARYKRGLAHAEEKVRAATLTAALKSRFLEDLLPELKKNVYSTNAELRRPAIAGLLALSHRNISVDGIGRNPREVALSLLKSNPTSAPEIVAGLLRLHIPIPDALIPALLALPEEVLVLTVAAHGLFLDQLNSEFLRETALGKNNLAAAYASALLACKASRKNSATLECIRKVLNTGEPTRINVLLSTFASDSEFSRVLRGETASNTPSTFSGATNDRFAAMGSVPASIAGDAIPDSSEAPAGTFAGSHIPRNERPNINSITQFFEALSQISRNRKFSPDIQNKALHTLYQESGAAQHLDFINALVNSGEPDKVQTAIQISLRFHDDPRLLETVLIAYITDKITLDDNIAQIGHFLSRGHPQQSRTLSAIGRQLIVLPDTKKRIIGLILTGAHGIPADAGPYILPSLADPSPLVRRAAYHALSQAAPEVFALNLERVANDPSPLVRLVASLAFFRTGYRWEHIVNDKLTFAQWVEPVYNLQLQNDRFLLLRQLEADADPGIRLNTRFALLHHGRLDKPATLTSESTPADNPRFSTRLIAGIHAARAAGHSLPKSLTDLAPPLSGAPLPPTPMLVFFLNPDNPLRHPLDTNIEILRATNPGIRIQVYYNGSEKSDRERAALFKVYPVSLAQKNAPVLIFSSGTWLATSTAPDLADLRELAATTALDDPLRLEHILQLPVSQDSTGYRLPLYVRLGIGLFLLVLIGCLIAVALQILERRRRERQRLNYYRGNFPKN